MDVTERTARAPGSSANLGPGFDALGLALDCHVEVTIRPARALSVKTFGEGDTLAQDSTHLAVRIAAELLGHDQFEMVVRSSIPVARGLGSSAALAAAAAAAAGAEDPLQVATDFDGHPENAAASIMGGLVAATMVNGRPVVRRHRLDPGLSFVVVVPDRPLSTSKARAALPKQIDHADAGFNLGRMAILLAGLADASQLSVHAFEDRLHQPYRASLFPQAEELLRALTSANALGACWSGAGPSLLAVCRNGQESAVQAAAQSALDKLSVLGSVLILKADLRGLVVETVGGDRSDLS